MLHHTMIDDQDMYKLHNEYAMKKMMEYHVVPQYATEHEKEFMTRKYTPLIMKYAQLMDHVAPKICDKCEKSLRVPELAWRLAQNIDNFLCYTCIGKLEKEEATLEHNGRGMWTLTVKEEKNA